MKVAIDCKSPLLQKSLELFLSNHLAPIKHCDILIRDRECKKKSLRCFSIGNNFDADLQKPFSKAQLILALEQRYTLIQKRLNEKKNTPQKRKKEAKDFAILEKRIEMLTKEYQENIMSAIKAFYQ
ncbi:JHP0747 family [hydrothermal vent metagenome]|uniref:JHP0747 family n=1 Tax=hydrothermal vent metagenome TaxID=652676 RepID=A0A1W1D3N3_9ZZZZ